MIIRPVVMMLTILTGTASAHAILIDSVPAPLSHVPAGHLAVTLRYNSRIDAGRSKLTLQHGDADGVRLKAAAAATPDTLLAALDLTPGDYTIKWQVLATDGPHHPGQCALHRRCGARPMGH